MVSDDDSAFAAGSTRRSFINKCAIKLPKLSVESAVEEEISFAARRSDNETDFQKPLSSLPFACAGRARVEFTPKLDNSVLAAAFQ